MKLYVLLVVILVILLAMVIVVTVYTHLAAKSARSAFDGGNDKFDVIHDMWATRGTEEFRQRIASDAMAAMQSGIQAPIEELNQVTNSMKYVSGNEVSSFAIHVGQRKLFVSELQFLTEHALDEQTLVLYVGSAPGHKSAFLASLFPRAKFLLVDPNKFAIVPYRGVSVRQIHFGGFDVKKPAEIVAEALNRPEQIITVQSFFTDEFADAIANAGVSMPILFISDIRTNTSNTGEMRWDVDTDSPDDVDIVTNSAQQLLWIRRIQPQWSMLKFRLPFGNGKNPVERLQTRLEGHCFNDAVRRCKEELGLDFIGDFANGRFRYLPGKIRIQAWPGTTSTETRLVIGPGVPAEFVDFGTLSAYEDKFFWYNKIPRNFTAFHNPNVMPDIGFDHCNDCAIENAAWERYVAATGDRRGVRTLVRELTAHYLSQDGTSRGLIQNNHGHFFNIPRTFNEIRAAAAFVPRAPRRYTASDE